MKDAIEWTLAWTAAAGMWMLALAMVPPAHANPLDAQANPLHVGACLSPNWKFGWHMETRIGYGDSAPIRVRAVRFVEDWAVRLGLTEEADETHGRARMGCGNLIAELQASGGAPGEGL